MLKGDFFGCCTPQCMQQIFTVQLQYFVSENILGGSSQFKLKSVRYLKAAIRAELPGLSKSREVVQCASHQLELIQ